ncbi:hypothetical protein GCK72_016505 [Caenorhabditis remanei]|uniref:Uncharacterized protein n=1 Tax=Caenorhabditis remanei TaxID=31234 RepID=A0A6A5G4T8_CAERE|nr:hypothetical protein GCK72_016505 [Caenorhabditis remanei]KAF1749960.1 hypothetical protein GCK72_016505 [Caenorhabditis remanei]
MTKNSLIMHAAVITSFFTGPPSIIPEEESMVEEKIQKTPRMTKTDEEKLVDENSMECFLEFLIEFFN